MLHAYIKEPHTREKIGLVHVYLTESGDEVTKTLTLISAIGQSKSSINLPFHHLYRAWHPSVAFPASPYPETPPSWVPP